MGAKVRASKAQQAKEGASDAPEQESVITPLPCDPRAMWIFCNCVAVVAHQKWGAVHIPLLPTSDSPIGSWNLVLGTAIALVAILVYESSVAALKAADKSTLGFGLHPGSKLVTTGVFAYSRHPVFCAMLLLNLALAFGLDCCYYCNAMIPLLLYLHFCVAKEEAALEKAFGEQFKQYRDRTPKWFGPFR